MHKTTHSFVGTNPPPLKPPINDVVFNPTLQPYHRHDHRRRQHRQNTAISPPFMVTAAFTAATSSWLRNRRIRYLFLLLCSPILLVVLFFALPFLCAAELCLRRRIWQKFSGDSGGDCGDRLRRCEEGCCEEFKEEEKGLLHRYLEDQLLLVRSMYDCGDIYKEDEVEEEFGEIEDVENKGSGRIPLLR